MRTDPTVIKAPALASALGIDLKTLHNWANSGKFPHFRTFGGHLRFRRAEVAAALRAIGNPVPPEVEPPPAQEPAPFTRTPLPDRIERVYVAGPSTEVERCERVIAAVGEMGIQITHDWPAALADGHKEPALAPACLAGVAAADLVFVLAPFQIVPNPTIGAWAEMGAAAVLRKPVLLVGWDGTPIPFESLCHRVPTDKAALRMLRERAPGGAK